MSGGGVIGDETTDTLQGMIEANVKLSSRLSTDAWHAYRRLRDRYDHAWVSARCVAVSRSGAGVPDRLPRHERHERFAQRSFEFTRVNERSSSISRLRRLASLPFARV